MRAVMINCESSLCGLKREKKGTKVLTIALCCHPSSVSKALFRLYEAALHFFFASNACLLAHFAVKFLMATKTA